MLTDGKLRRLAQLTPFPVSDFVWLRDRMRNDKWPELVLFAMLRELANLACALNVDVPKAYRILRPLILAARELNPKEG